MGSSYILLVEDDSVHAQLFQRAFDKSFDSLPLKIANSLEMAKKLINESAPAVIFSDYMLPDGYGTELLLNLNEKANFPVIILTSHGDQEIAVNAMKQGAWDYMVKSNSLFDSLPTLAKQVLREWKAVELRKLSDRKLKRMYQAFAQSPVGVLISNLDRTIDYVNSTFTNTFSHTKRIVGDKINHITFRMQSETELQPLWDTTLRGQVYSCEIQIHTNNQDCWQQITASPVMDENGHVEFFVILSEDITLKKAFESRLLYQANYDQLTGLASRDLAADRLNLALAQIKRSNKRVALIFIDLDRFKNINDSLGHLAGDNVLVETAKRLRNCVREDHTVARFSGDEFLVIIPNIDNQTTVEHITKRISDTFNLPLTPAPGTVCYTTVSMGIAIAPEDGSDVETLLRHADTAMYQAKHNGRNTARFFHPEMNRKAEAQLSIETMLRHALAENRFKLHYQAIYDIKTKSIVGAEALLRMVSDKGDLIEPAQFIDVAEETGLILPIGQWVVNQAIQDASHWIALADAANQPFRLSINVSAKQFSDKAFRNLVANKIHESGITPEHIELEITERALMKNSDETISTLQKFSAIGIRLSIDDFGTGYSSLNYLKQFPVNSLKIDRCFLSEVSENNNNAELVSAMIVMGHALGLEIVGEGIETEHQNQFLSKEGCDYVQGYYLSRPVNRAQFDRLMNGCTYTAKPHRA